MLRGLPASQADRPPMNLPAVPVTLWQCTNCADAYDDEQVALACCGECAPLDIIAEPSHPWWLDRKGG